jgi:hypothetical protein
VPNLRELFHKIGNLHNKISVGAGLTKAELRRKFRDASGSNQALTRLSDLEKIAVEASRELRKLKEIIYKYIDPDTGKPKP